MTQPQPDRRTVKRMPDKTARSLEDINSHAREAQTRALAVAVRQAARYQNPVLNLALARLGLTMAEIERMSRDARQGISTDSPSPDLYLFDEE